MNEYKIWNWFKFDVGVWSSIIKKLSQVCMKNKNRRKIIIIILQYEKKKKEIRN